MHLFPISKSEAFSHLQDELDINPGFFNDGGPHDSTVVVGDYLYETHGVDRTEASEWAEEWSMLPENAKRFGFISESHV